MENSKGQIKKVVVKNLFWKFGESVSSNIISFVISVVLARLLMPSEYGLIAMTSIFLSIANVFTCSGLGVSLVQKKDADRVDFSTAFYTGLIVAIVIYGLLFCASGFIAEMLRQPEIKDILRVLGLQLPFSAFNSVQQAEISRNMQFKKVFYRTIVCSIISGIVGISLAYRGFGVWALIYSSFAGLIANVIFTNRVIEWRPTLEFSTQRFKTLFSFGSKYMGANLLGCFFNELRGFLIGLRYNPASLAYYNRGEGLPKLIYSNIDGSISSVLFPALSKMQDNPQNVKNAMRRSMKTSSFVMAPLMVGLAALSSNIVSILYTDKWLMCVPFMQVLCFKFLFDIIGTTNLQAMNAIGRSGTVLKLEFLKKPIYIVFILTGMCFSALGIAVACLLYSIVASALNAWPNSKYLKYTVWEQFVDVLTPLLFATIMYVVVYFVGEIELSKYLVLLLQILLGGVTYIILSFLFQRERFDYVLSVFKKNR